MQFPDEVPGSISSFKKLWRVNYTPHMPPHSLACLEGKVLGFIDPNLSAIGYSHSGGGGRGWVQRGENFPAFLGFQAQFPCPKEFVGRHL